MAVAKIMPEPEKGGRGKKGYRNDNVSAQRLSHARTVIKYAPDPADSVLSGATPLNEAYATAQERKQASVSTETRLAKIQL